MEDNTHVRRAMCNVPDVQRARRATCQTCDVPDVRRARRATCQTCDVLARRSFSVGVRRATCDVLTNKR
jgi:hypothetical protein